MEGVLYIHAMVTRTYDKPQLPDLNFRMGDKGGDDIFLALGLNNHYVGGYYWARSGLGIGSAAEAPGVVVDVSNGKLMWGELNSNDGKRSEWVEFLKEGDQVQLGVKDPKSLKGINEVVNEDASSKNVMINV
eukprot:CAMPEP_0118642678 /NCGR_PEP_ID=MMETSP0785-20121206/5961_1 /TAXON_ID=91992 /ORGANISM="Bolidomonas pacifica, Strain CCMP 1866" /LENGTH=131 /DNA_ID=CAMNT_0006534241 /DNA_START=302 /DNA_END=693 /DNA_ORIENTATION=-